MTNVFQDIFGGSSQSSSSQSTPTNMNPFTTALQGTVTNAAQQPLPQYTGDLAAPMTGNEGSLLQTLMGQTAQGGGAAGTNDYLANVLKGSYLPGQSGGNPFLSGAITAAQRTTNDNLTNTLSKSLPGYFTANGQMISPNNNGQGGSSAFDTAGALAFQSAANADADIASTIGSNAYTAERTNQQQAAQLSQAEISNTVQNLQAQALPRLIQQQGIQNGLSLFQTNMQGVLQLLQTLGGIAQPVIGNTAQASSQGSSTAGILPDLYKPGGGGGGGGATPTGTG